MASTTAAAAGTDPHRRGRRDAQADPQDYGPVQVLRRTGLDAWQWDAGRAAGLIPPPDTGTGRWSAAAATALAARRDQIIAAVGTDAPVGGHRAARRLAERTGLDVEKADIEVLADGGLLTPAGWYKNWPLWDCRALDSVSTEAVSAAVAEREAWIACSVGVWDAPGYLGWRRDEFRRIAARRGLKAGSLDRYAVADLDALAADEDLAEQVRGDRLLMSGQAAVHLEIRDTDFRYLIAAGLVTPRTHTAVQVTRHRWVDVPLYRTADLEELRGHPGIDWESVRSVRAGDPSPLRHLARNPASRPAVIRRGIAELGDRYGTEVWAWWNPGAGGWEVDFERLDGGPSPADFEAAIASHPCLREHRDVVAVATEAGAAIRWARAMREPGAAVILDTETTGLAGYIVEVAVLDAATGRVLLDTLVSSGCPVEPEARWVHGITDEQLASAPPLADVLPRLLAVTRGRTVLAYNAGFDYDTLVRHTGRDSLDPGHLGEEHRWSCLMSRRSDWLMRRRWLPLGGGHRARGDCEVALDLLAAMTAPARQPKALRR